MRRHLLNSDGKDALCELDVLEVDLGFEPQFTDDPYQTECPACRQLYGRLARKWWLAKVGYIPIGARYELIDRGIPGLFGTLLRS